VATPVAAVTRVEERERARRAGVLEGVAAHDRAEAAARGDLRGPRLEHVAVPFASPPEKITMRLPLKALCTTWRMRSARVSIGMPVLLVDLLGARAARGASFGGLTLMMCAPSCAAICAA
jgi:hypothetical protein